MPHPRDRLHDMEMTGFSGGPSKSRATATKTPSHDYRQPTSTPNVSPSRQSDELPCYHGRSRPCWGRYGSRRSVKHVYAHDGENYYCCYSRCLTKFAKQKRAESFGEGIRKVHRLILI